MPRDQDTTAPEPHFWTGEETFKLVHRIASDPKLRDRFFPLDPNDTRAASSLRRTEKALCLELLVGTVWMDSMITFGWIRRDGNGTLEATNSWNHDHSPVSNRLDWVKKEYERMQGNFKEFTCPSELPWEKQAAWETAVRRRKGDWYFIYRALKAREDRMLEKLLANANNQGIKMRYGLAASPPPSPKRTTLEAGSSRQATTATKTVKRRMAEMEESVGRRPKGKMSMEGKAPGDKKTGRRVAMEASASPATRPMTPLILDRCGAPITDPQTTPRSSVPASSNASGSSIKAMAKKPIRGKADAHRRAERSVSLGCKSNPIRFLRDEPPAPLPDAGIDPLQWLCPNRIAREKRIEERIDEERSKEPPAPPRPDPPRQPSSDIDIDSDDEEAPPPRPPADRIAVTTNDTLLPFGVSASSTYVPPALDFGDDDPDEHGENEQVPPSTPPLTAEYGWPVEEQEMETRLNDPALAEDDNDQLVDDEPQASLRTAKVEIQLDMQQHVIVPNDDGGELPMDIFTENQIAERTAEPAIPPSLNTVSPIRAPEVGKRGSSTSPGLANLPPRPRWVTAPPTSPERTSLLAERLATRRESTDERDFWIVGPRWEEAGRREYWGEED